MTKYSDTQHKAIKAYRQGKKSIQIIYSDTEYKRITEYCQSINTPIATWIKRIIAESIPDHQQEQQQPKQEQEQEQEQEQTESNEERQ